MPCATSSANTRFAVALSDLSAATARAQPAPEAAASSPSGWEDQPLEEDVRCAGYLGSSRATGPKNSRIHYERTCSSSDTR